MTAPPTSIVSWSSADKVPGFVGEVLYGQGPISVSSIPTYCLLVGQKLSAGIAAPDVDVVDIRSTDEADLWFGAGSETARMCYAALRVSGASLKATATATPGGVTAASVAIAFTGSWSTGGSWYFRIGGVPISGGITSTDTPTTVAAAVASAINQNPRIPATATSTAGGVAVTWKQSGARGNWGTIYQDVSKYPAGMNEGITSGAAGSTQTGGNVMVRFGGGAGVEVPSTTIANLFAGQFKYMALAQNDLTSITTAGMWRDTNVTKAGPLEGRPQFVHVATTDTAANANTLASGINDQLFSVLWQNNGESHPAEIAAAFAAMRQVTEQADPGAMYDGAVLPGILPQVLRGDRPARSVQVAALNSGVTPVTSTDDGKATVVRAITSHCLSGSTPDYRTLDTADAAVPQYIRLAVGLFWSTSFVVANPRVADDVATGAPPRPAGVATPALWNASLTNLLRTFEKGVNGSPPLIVDVDANLPSSGYDSTAKRIVSLCPTKVAAGNHQCGISIRQIAALAF